MIMYCAIILNILLITKLSAGTIFININVNKNDTTRKLNHFWRSTGFCPLGPREEIYRQLLSEEQIIHFALIGSLPNGEIQQVRIHWLINLIKISTESGNSYNFTHLDNFLTILKRFRLRPGFELMGYPSSNNSLGNDTKVNWAKLVEEIAVRYIDKFGMKEVSKWRFETWNEPDLKSYNILNFTLQEYLEYVNGCAKGLKNAFGSRDKKGVNLKLGGPAGLFRDKLHPLCWGLLENCNSSGESQCPIQFISFHRKGDGTAQGVLNGTLELLDLISNKFPGLKTMTVANDEADIQKTWSDPLEWRGDTRYAAMVTKVIIDYYKSVELERNIKTEVLSNDNGFLNYHPFYFTQRTLFARFQMNLTDPPHSQFIKKPVYSVMALLSILGEEYLQEDSNLFDPLLTVFTSRSRKNNYSFVSVLVVYANDTDVNIEDVKTINVTVYNLACLENSVVVYMLNNIDTNPYEVWKRGGQPVFPGKYLREQMRAVEEPLRLMGPQVLKQKKLSISLNVTVPTVSLVNVCSKSSQIPGRVTMLNVLNVTRHEVLVTWRDRKVGTRCIRTYEVELESRCSRTSGFKRVNPNDTIFLSYHLVATGEGPCEATRGRYRVRAVDYWDRPGKYSKVVHYP